MISSYNIYVKAKNFIIFAVFIAITVICMIIARPIRVRAAVENELEITIRNANVFIDISEDGRFHYKYKRSLYIIDKEREDSITKISVKKRTNKSSTKDSDIFVKISIPDKIYTKITGIVKNGGLSIPSVNTDITIKNYSSAVSLSLPSGFNKKVSYTGKNGSGSIIMDGKSKFIIDVKISDTALSTFWAGSSAGDDATYQYQQEGKNKRAKIKLNLKNCSFVIEERKK